MFPEEAEDVLWKVFQPWNKLPMKRERERVLALEGGHINILALDYHVPNLRGHAWMKASMTARHLTCTPLVSRSRRYIIVVSGCRIAKPRGGNILFVGCLGSGRCTRTGVCVGRIQPKEQICVRARHACRRKLGIFLNPSADRRTSRRICGLIRSHHL